MPQQNTKLLIINYTRLNSYAMKTNYIRVEYYAINYKLLLTHYERLYEDYDTGTTY